MVSSLERADRIRARHTVWQRRRRCESRAGERLQCFLIGMCQKQVFNITSMDQLPEVQRLRELARAAEIAGLARHTIIALCILDAAVRNPFFTATIIRKVLPGSGEQCEEKVLKAALRTRKKHLHMYWCRLALSNLKIGVNSWTADKLLRAGRLWVDAGDTAKCRALLRAIQSLPRVGHYLGHALLRTVAAAMDTQVRGGEAVAADMSLSVQLLYDVVPFRTMRGRLLSEATPSARHWTWDLLAALYCEATRCLRDEGVLDDLTKYVADREALLAALAGPACRALLSRLNAAPVLEEWFSAEAHSVKLELNVQSEMKSLQVLQRFRAAMARV